jgi:hypothetical protein
VTSTPVDTFDHWSTMRGSPKGCTPMPTAARSGRTSRPKISATQISADRSGASSRPIIQSAAMLLGSAGKAARSSKNPYCGVNSS